MKNCMFGCKYEGDDADHWDNDCLGNPEAKNQQTKQQKVKSVD